MPINTRVTSQIQSNIRAHDKIAKKYELRHGEIYNEIEQTRLKDALTTAVALLSTDTKTKLALDFGCGAGNLTSHMSSLGMDVLACDVSQGFLDLISSRSYHTKVETKQINGSDLSDIASNTIDMIATYSVLHHVPDYLGILAEFVRVLKPGGIIFIDHEASKEVWVPTEQRLAYLRETSENIESKWHKYLKLENYVNWFIWKFINSRYRSEGDIHVFADDHIEWDLVASRLADAGAVVMIEKNYLLFRRGANMDVYKKYCAKTTDMRLIVARKL